MTALREILRVVEAVPPPLRRRRKLVVGVSAERAIVAELRISKDVGSELPEEIEGVSVYRTPHFKGWSLE